MNSPYNSLLKNSLMFFTQCTFVQLNPKTEFLHSPHLDLIAAKLEGCAMGRCKRLIICLPPRSLKSIFASVAFPAWVLARWPHKQIICASYGQDLADKHARDCRIVITSPKYQRAFPGTRLSSEKRSVSDFATTAKGFRMATSVEGVLTGRGGDILIIDDPLKPWDAYSDTKRGAANDWVDHTCRSRLNNKEEGVIIVVMQRLHQDDLVGHLLEKESWEVLRLPAIAEENERFEANTVLGPVVFERSRGEILDPRRETVATLEKLRSSMGSYVFESQYQQNPQPKGGAIIKTDWLRYYRPDECPRHFTYKLQSWDTANKSEEVHDYSVCTTWGLLGKDIYLLDVYRDRLDFPDLGRAVRIQFDRHRPQRVLVEDKASGIQLLQNFRNAGLLLTAYSAPPGYDKEMRLFAQSAVIESGRVYLPAAANWLGEYVRELTGFPNTKFADQVDSTTQALDHFSKRNNSGGSIQELRL